jgi:hypothetical protein
MVNPQVLNFFLAGAVILAVVAFRFLRTANPTFRLFGIGLAMYSAAFAIWASIVALQPAELTTWTSVGVAFFGGAHLFYVASAVSDFSKPVQRNLLVVAVVFLLGLFVLRTWILPSAPSFSPAGLFYFNAEAPVMLGYILVFAGSFMPAIHVVSSHIAQKNLAMFTRIFFNLTVLTAVVLLTSADETLQYWNGAVMALGLLGLLVNFVTTTPRYKTIA